MIPWRRRIFSLLAAGSFLLCAATLWANASMPFDLFRHSKARPYIQIRCEDYRFDLALQKHSWIRHEIFSIDRQWQFGGILTTWFHSRIRDNWIFRLSIPLDYIFIATLPLPIWWLLNKAKHLETKIAQTQGRCAKCGYDLRATPEICPECGTAILPVKSPLDAGSD